MAEMELTATCSAQSRCYGRQEPTATTKVGPALSRIARAPFPQVVNPTAKQSANSPPHQHHFLLATTSIYPDNCIFSLSTSLLAHHHRHHNGRQVPLC
jgi:hypothetical protein